jgi:hypothetical protein
VITANVENAGQVQVELDKSRTRLVTATRSLGEPGWTPFAPLGIFHEQSAVQSNETISDQVWIEIPDDDLVALRTDFVVARVVTEEERRKRGNVIWGLGGKRHS